MEFKQLTAISIICLLVIIPVVVSAGGTGSVTVIHKNADGSLTDITKDNHNEGDSKSNGKISNQDVASTLNINPTITPTVYPTEVSPEERNNSIKALQTGMEKSYVGYTNTMIDQMYEGSVAMYATDIETDSNGGVYYTASVKELNPFDHPVVVPMLLISGVFLILTTIIVILLSAVIAGAQTYRPESYGDWKYTASGVYVPYNPIRVHKVCVWAITRPAKAFIAFVVIILLRNYFVASMLQASTGVLSTATDNIYIRAITGLAMFVSSFQTQVGEYGVYIFGSFIFIMYIITDFVILCDATDAAKRIELVAWGAFGVFCVCDLIRIGCVGFGIITSQWLGSPIFVSVGLVFGALVNCAFTSAVLVFVALNVIKAVRV
jgi:hypothetical protein